MCMYFIVIRVEQFCDAKLQFLFEICKKNRPEERFLLRVDVFFWGGEIGVVVETPQSLCDSSPINKGAENVKGENGKVR